MLLLFVFVVVLVVVLLVVFVVVLWWVGVCVECGVGWGEGDGVCVPLQHVSEGKQSADVEEHRLSTEQKLDEGADSTKQAKAKTAKTTKIRFFIIKKPDVCTIQWRPPSTVPQLVYDPSPDINFSNTFLVSSYPRKQTALEGALLSMVGCHPLKNPARPPCVR